MLRVRGLQALQVRVLQALRLLELTVLNLRVLNLRVLNRRRPQLEWPVAGLLAGAASRTR